MSYPSTVDLAHGFLRSVVRPGEAVLDGTAGAGYDTAFLADLVGEDGLVYAFDVQSRAEEETRARLEELGFAERLRFFLRSHAELAETLPIGIKGQLGAAVFNLGYLPGGDHRLTTRRESTMTALAQAINWLRPGGLLVVVLYPGHTEGAAEKAQVDAWLADIPRSWGFVGRFDFPQFFHRPPPELRLFYRAD